MSNGNGANEPELLVEGFEKLDDHLLDRQAPKLSLLPGFYDRDHKTQVHYLLRLASTMNHAARLISEERDRLVKLLVLKDKQIKILADGLEANNVMIQSEVTRMNEQKQEYHANVSELGARIRELESGHID